MYLSLRNSMLTGEYVIEYNIVSQYRGALSIKEPIFGAEMTQELARHGYNISPGTLYPTLHRLEKEGYLKNSSRVVEGRVRKYYRVTAEGKQVLEQSRKKIRELVTEVIEEK